MEYRIEAYDALCSLKVFEINGRTVDDEDCFFTKCDRGRYDEDKPEYVCGDMQGTPAIATPEILNKYNINLDEFNEIAQKAANAVSFGRCGLCV